MQRDPSAELAARLKAAKDAPRSVVAQRNLGLTYEHMGRTQDALNAFKAALFLAPGDPGTLVSMANAYNKSGKPDRARKACERALESDPKHVGALSNLGSALRQLSHFAEAAKAYEAAISIDSKSAPLYMNLGKLKLAQEDNKAAIAAYIAAIKINPNNADAYASLGEAYRRIGQADAAIDAFQRAIKCNPKHVQALLNLGNTLTQFGFLQEAAAVYVRALPASNQDPKVLTQLGNCLYKLGEMDKAILAFRRAIAGSEKVEPALVRLLVFPRGSLTDEIIGEIKNTLARVPDDKKKTPLAQFAQAHYLRHTGQINAAFSLIKRANEQEALTGKEAIAAHSAQCDAALERLRQWQPRASDVPAVGLTPIFILGPSRSGKSTLEHIISRSPAVAPFFEGLWAGGYRFGNSAVDGNESGPQRIETGFAARFQEHLSGTGVRFGTYTNPHTLLNIDRVIDLLPDARFIAVKRDKLDIAAEIFATHYVRANFYSYDPYYLMRYLDWYDDMLDAVEQKMPGKIMHVGVHDLAQDQTAVLNEIASHVASDIDTQNVPSASFLKGKSVYRDHFEALLNAQT